MCACCVFAFGFLVQLSVYPSTLSHFISTLILEKNRRKVHTRGRNSMPSVTSLVIRLVDPYRRNLTVTMPMYVFTYGYFCYFNFEVIDMLHF